MRRASAATRSALLRPSSLVGDENAAAEIGRDLGLRYRCARQACARSSRQLPPGDLGCLVGLEMGSQAARPGREKSRHALDVPLHHGDIDDDRGGRNLSDVSRRRTPVTTQSPRPLPGATAQCRSFASCGTGCSARFRARRPSAKCCPAARRAREGCSRARTGPAPRAAVPDANVCGSA